jgi:hypothetical protein
MENSMRQLLGTTIATTLALASTAPGYGKPTVRETAASGQ